MKKTRRIFVLLYSFLALSIITALTLTLIFENEGTTAYASTSPKDKKITVLIAGLDEAAENTDVLMLATLQSGREAAVLQIPRDTYVKTDLYEGKINHLYRACVEKYGNKSGAEEYLKRISDLFGISVDRYAIFTGKNLEDLVNTVGGVTLEVPFAFTYTDGDGKNRSVGEGKQHLDGSDALAYVRYRSAYAEGDLGRLDAQMRFIAALTKQLLEERSLRTYFRIYQKNYRNLLTNVTEKDIINIIQDHLAGKADKDGSSLRLMRLPGEACRGNEGAWYYVLNKNGAAEMLARFFGGTAPLDFDKAGRFVRRDREAFLNIYNAKGYECRIYSLDEAAKAQVLHK